MSENLLAALLRLGATDLLPAEIERLLGTVALQGAEAPDAVGDLKSVAGTAGPQPGTLLPPLGGVGPRPAGVAWGPAGADLGRSRRRRTTALGGRPRARPARIHRPRP